ncbi:DUF1941 family protein [Metarhizium album ARSEF 1941]|uniref:DUF1941 family protein n=1 Tax=Metarhizium album (strain ARSEF 1941) TaxID=1081103 RepID=A0A0B2WX60_METAS|nr:DUF1941 family protein [Metarhizium album ARSEF 1941]KHO00807.1 DUF1941 family protein [Metarhizium album ARSEF 1941]
MDQPAAQPSQSSQDVSPDSPNATVSQIQTFLKSKDDTQRFVGLALLKSVLDNTPDLRQDEQVVETLWDSISPRFLGRLIKTGSKVSGENTKEMLDLAVSVMHTFAALLPASARGDDKFTQRVPGLVGAVLYSSAETTAMLLQLLHTLVSTPEGAKAFIQVGDVSALSEIAPTHAIVMDIFCFAWLNGMAGVVEKHVLISQVVDTVQSLVSSFSGTDAVLPVEPAWLKTVVGFIQTLVTSRPNAAARSAYTNAAASLLQAYPQSAPQLLFTEDPTGDKPFGYLLVNLMLIDIRSCAPTLLGQLNSPEYARLSRRLASAFDVISIFIGHLVRCLQDESLDTLIMSPDNLLRLRKGISETMSLAMEYLRDRWDATFAGAMGLHPDARASTAETVSGSHRTLAWDSMVNTADEDPLILSAVRALALWLREDENEMLRKEATGLIDMLMELYQSSSSEKLDFREAILVGMEALVTLPQGRQVFLHNDGWKILSKDLASLIHGSDGVVNVNASRGVEIVRVLLSVAEDESSGTSEEWMDLVTVAAAWDVPWQDIPPQARELQVAVLQLCCTLLVGAGDGMRNRYKQSIAAIQNMAAQLKREASKDGGLAEAMEDVVDTLNGVTVALPLRTY